MPTKKYKFQVLMRVKDRPAVTVMAKSATVTNRGDLVFYDEHKKYLPLVVASFCAGSWLSMQREEGE